MHTLSILTLFATASAVLAKLDLPTPKASRFVKGKYIVSLANSTSLKRSLHVGGCFLRSGTTADPVRRSPRRSRRPSQLGASPAPASKLRSSSAPTSSPAPSSQLPTTLTSRKSLLWMAWSRCGRSGCTQPRPPRSSAPASLQPAQKRSTRSVRTS